MSNSYTSSNPSWGGDSGVFLLSTSLKCSLHIARLASLFCSSSILAFYRRCLSVTPSWHLFWGVIQLLLSSVFCLLMLSFGFLCHPPPFVISHTFIDSGHPSIWSRLFLNLCCLSLSWCFFFSSISFQEFLLILGLFFFPFFGPNTSPADFTYAIYCCTHLSMILVSAVSSLCSSNSFFTQSLNFILSIHIFVLKGAPHPVLV